MPPREPFFSSFQPSKLEIVREESVFINHPVVGHPLFIFPAYSGEPNTNDPSTTVFGVCYNIALDSCRIITNYAANNREDFFAKDCEGKTPISSNDVDMEPLTPGDYYYFLGPPEVAGNRNYPIVKSFSAFRFPNRLPEHWYHTRPSARLASVEAVSSSNMSNHVASRDKHCVLSGYRSFNKCAHLVPKAEEAWFAANKMYVYSAENMAASVNTHTNGISLRDDIYRCFDSNAFVFYPAGDGDAFMAYFVGMGGYPDYTEKFHRRLATIHPSVAVEFLYARFAYTVIKLYRFSAFFNSVEDNDEVRKAAEQTLSEKAAKQAQGIKRMRKAREPDLPTMDEGGDTRMNEESEHSRAPGDDELDVGSSPASNQSIQSLPQVSYADGDERWKEELFKRIPAIATLEEVENPPDTVACHTETPHMLRLASKYMKENPQVWKTSTTPQGATRDDVEGFYAKLITRPSST